MKRPARPITTTEKVLDMQDYLKYYNYRNYVLFLVGVTTGYRAGDLVKLKVRDIKEAIRRKEFTILEGKKKNSKNIREKNRKPRSVELIPGVEKILKEYIKDKKDYEYIFQSRKGTNKHIGVQAVSNILKKAGEYFGLHDITAHSMRKTYAYKLYIEALEMDTVREQNQLNTLFNGDKYRQSLYSGSVDFDRVFNSTNLDDHVIGLPDRLKNEYSARKRAFIEKCMQRSNGGVVNG